MGDIWRMAWDQKSTKIVMLTKLVEEGKVSEVLGSIKNCNKKAIRTNLPFLIITLLLFLFLISVFFFFFFFSVCVLHTFKNVKTNNKQTKENKTTFSSVIF